MALLAGLAFLMVSVMYASAVMYDNRTARIINAFGLGATGTMFGYALGLTTVPAMLLSTAMGVAVIVLANVVWSLRA